MAHLTHTKKHGSGVRERVVVSRWVRGPYYSSRSQWPRMLHLSHYGQQQPAFPFRLLPCPNLHCPSPLGGGQKSSQATERRNRAGGGAWGQTMHGEWQSLASTYLPKGGTWWGLDTRGQQWFFFQHQARDRTGETRKIRPQNWTTMPTYTTKCCPLPRRPHPSFRALYSQVLTSQRLLGKVLDIYILVLRQLLQDGLDFTLQCAGKGGKKKVVNKARLRQGNHRQEDASCAGKHQERHTISQSSIQDKDTHK